MATVELRLHLGELARRTHRMLGVPDGVGATLLVEGRAVYAGSNPFTDAVDEVQYRLGRGPCVTAVASRRVVRSRTIGAEERGTRERGAGERRWGSFTPQAGALGLRSVVSLPVRLEGTVVGSLNLYGHHAATFDTTTTHDLGDSSAAAARTTGLADASDPAGTTYWADTTGTRGTTGSGGTTDLAVAGVLFDTDTVGRAMASAWLVAVAAANAQALGRAVGDREDIDVAVGLLMDRYRMSASHARILIGQLAAQDHVSKPDAARSLLESLADPSPGSATKSWMEIAAESPVGPRQRTAHDGLPQRD